MSLVLAILVFIIVAGIVWWAATSLLAAFSIPDPIRTVVLVVLVLVLLLAFLSYAGIPLHLPR